MTHRQYELLCTAQVSSECAVALREVQSFVLTWIKHYHDSEQACPKALGNSPYLLGSARIFSSRIGKIFRIHGYDLYIGTNAWQMKSTDHQKGDLLTAQEAALPPIQLTLHRSRYLVWLFSFSHGGAVICLSMVESTLSTKLIVGVAIMASAFFCLCEHALRCSRNSITTLLWTAEDVWQLWTRGGQIIIADLKPGKLRSTVYIQPYLVVLHFHTGKRFGKSLVLVPDMMDDANGFRRLRIRLRFKSVFQQT